MEIKTVLSKLVDKKDLSEKEAKSLFQTVISGRASSAQAAAILAALAVKGESAIEIKSLVEVIRSRALKIKVSRKYSHSLLDTCGTGGSRVKTFNISTCSAFILASADLKIAKHGNRSASGVCGSADVLEKLGINITAPPARVKESIERINIGFMFAPLYHPALKTAAPVRKDLGIKTIFNLAGPLCNPAGAGAQILGVYEPGLVRKIALVLKSLGIKKAFVLSSSEGVDEITLSSTARIAYVGRGRIKEFSLNPSDFGLPKVKLSSISVKTLEKNVEVFLGVLKGRKSVFRNVVLANAALGFVLMSKAKTWKKAVQKAAYCLDSGLAFKKFEQLRQFYR